MQRGRLYFRSDDPVKGAVRAVRFVPDKPYSGGECIGRDRAVSYESEQIDSLLHRQLPPRGDAGGLYVAPALPEFEVLFAAAVAPAMAKNGLRTIAAAPAFTSDSPLAEVCLLVRSAGVIVADLSTLNADVLYVLGLCHGLGRCPIQIVRRSENLSFNLRGLRTIEYADDGTRSLWKLRDALARAIRAIVLSKG